MSIAQNSNTNQPRYHAQVGVGDVRLLTLDQLDVAFNAGLVGPETYLCIEGSREWRTLGELADLDDARAEPSTNQERSGSRPSNPAAKAQSIVPAPMYSNVPVVISMLPISQDNSPDNRGFDMPGIRPRLRVKLVASVAVTALCALGFVAAQSAGSSTKRARGDASERVGAKLGRAEGASEPPPNGQRKLAAAIEARVDSPTAEVSSVASDPKPNFKLNPSSGIDAAARQPRIDVALHREQKNAEYRASRERAKIVAKKRKAEPLSGLKVIASDYDPLNGAL